MSKYEHDGCDNCKYFNSNEAVPNSTCYDCKSAHTNAVLEDKYEPRNNADKIRKMSNEELAMTIMCPES